MTLLAFAAERRAAAQLLVDAPRLSLPSRAALSSKPAARRDLRSNDGTVV